MDANEVNPYEFRELRFRAEMQRRRTEQGLSQGELARKVTDLKVPEFHQTTVSRIEKGTRAVRLGEAEAIAAALGTTTERMVREEQVVQQAEHILKTYGEYADYQKQLLETMQNYLYSAAQAWYLGKTYEPLGSEEEISKLFGDQVRAAISLMQEDIDGSIDGIYLNAISNVMGRSPLFCQFAETYGQAELLREAEKAKDRWFSGLNESENDGESDA